MCEVDLHPQDQMIIIEALAYWAHDMDDRAESFDRSDPRRNRGAELAEQFLDDDCLPDDDYRELVDLEWAGPSPD
jgi:hypothetical protein